MKYLIAGGLLIAQRSHPARGGWIEMGMSGYCGASPASHPARGGWIEMDAIRPKNGTLCVPPRTGWVD